MSALLLPSRRRFLVLALVCAAVIAVAPIANAQSGKKKPKAPTAQKLPSLPMAVVGPVSITATPPPPAALPDTKIYDGQSLASAGISLADWGSGSSGQSQDISHSSGGNAIKVTTLGYYAGTVIGFKTPVDLGDRNPSVNRIFQILIRFADSGDSAMREEVPLEQPVKLASFQLAQRRRPTKGGGNRGRVPGRPTTPVPARPPVMSQSGSSDTGWQTPFQTIRLLFTLANGAQVDVIRPVPSPGEIDSIIDSRTAWYPISIPLSVLHFPVGQDSSPLQSITLGGGAAATFYLGQIRLVDDTTPITCTAPDTQDVARGDVVTLSARANGGASALKYSWDFDSSDGVTEQAFGQTVTTEYLKGNRDYTVTLTVSDVNGIKKPASATTVIKVED